MIAWHADDYGICAYDHDIIMPMMICEEWELYGAMTSPIETTEWRRWNISMINTQIRAWLTNAFMWKRVQLSSWLEIIYFTGRWQSDADSKKKPDGRILRILPSLAIDFGADPWPSRCCIMFREWIFSRRYIGLSRSCFFQLRQLRTIRRSLSKEATRLPLHVFVVSRLDYCNALFTGLPPKSIGNLQVIQNTAARLFVGLRKYDHVTSTMKTELHWLRIPERISFKLSTLVYKALRGEGPAYPRELCIPVSDNFHLSRQRFANQGDLFVPRTHMATYGKRAFSAAGSATWNSLPVEIHYSQTLLFSSRNWKLFCSLSRTL